MSRKPEPAGASCALASGIVALGCGLALLTASRTLLVADAHFGYEDVMGGGAALPLWSATEMAVTIAIAARQTAAREIIFLGDIIHGSQLSGGAQRVVAAALDGLRAIAALTLVAGNHEGRTRGAAVLGETFEQCERDNWLLVHGDKPTVSDQRTIIGHLHPSLPVGGGVTSPAFLGSERIVVIPALTPYSTGLDVLSEQCIAALGSWNVRRCDLHVVVASNDRVFPFGTLSQLCTTLGRPQTRRLAPAFVRRRHLKRG